MRDDEPVPGEVLRWSPEDGWGVLRSDFGTVFAHFSVVHDRHGHRNLIPGARVWFHAERPGQDGCDLRAVDVWTAGPPFPDAGPPPAGPPGAYRSSLTITRGDSEPDDPPDGSPPPRP